MKRFENEMIRASAGTGKTYRLVSRYVALLACGADPRSVLTLTFTRKAAGEFFSRIVSRLADYADDPSKGQAFAQENDLPDDIDFGAILRNFLRSLPYIQLSTLDSFFLHIARLFPHELGIPSDFQIIQDAPLARVRRDTLAATLRSSDTGELAESLKRAFIGHDKATVADTLDEWLENRLPIFELIPDTDKWGAFDKIFPALKPWTDQREENRQKETKSLLDWLRDHELTSDKQVKAIDEIADFLLKRMPVTPAENDTIRDNFLKAEQAVRSEADAKWTIAAKKYPLEGERADQLRSVANQWLEREATAMCVRTRARAEILKTFEAVWKKRVTETGGLTFHDLPVLLSAGGEGLWTQVDGRAEHLLRLDQRLDERLKHWLLDEFQDTSPLQWRVVENLIDETIQDAEGDRSLFAVGDTKQALYGFRGGDDRLLPHLLNRYRDGGLKELTMSETRRCGAAVINFVNQIFNPSQPSFQKILGERVKQRWNFQTHTCEASVAERPSHAALIGTEPDPLEAVIQTLREAATGTRAILLRTRKEVTRWVVALNRAGFPATGAAETPLPERNPFALAMLALLRQAAHPKDTMAREHFLMSSLGAWARQEGKNHGELGAEALHVIGRDGFSAWARLWVDRVSTPTDPDAEELLRFCDTQDETSDKNPDTFHEEACQSRAKNPAAPNAIQIMTIHASKGLEFDTVILPELTKITFQSRDKLPPIGVAEDDHMRPLWAIDMPVSAIAEMMPGIAEVHERNISDASYQNLCALYVAITRAKSKLYIFAPLDSKSGSYAANFIRESLRPAERDWNGLSVLAEAGEPFSVEENEPLAEPTETPLTLTPLIQRIPRALTRRKPSGEKQKSVQARVTVSQGRKAALARGNLLHAMMERVGWVDEETPEQRRKTWEKAGLNQNPLFEEILSEVETLLRPGEAADLLSRKGKPTRLYRERTFELVLDGSWVSGSFDRVQWADTGDIVLIDYKTNQVTESAVHQAAEEYRAQMMLYCHALALLSEAPPSITAALLFTRIGKVVWIPPGGR